MKHGDNLWPPDDSWSGQIRSIRSSPDIFYVCFTAHVDSTGVFIYVFCSSIPVVLFDIQGIFRCLKILVLTNPYLCCIKGFISDLLVARNDIWVSLRPSRGPNKYIVLPELKLKVRFMIP